MKKTLFTMILAATAMNINAQLVVDSLGRVGIGTENPKTNLAVGGEGDSIYAIYCHPTNKQYGISVKNYFNSTNNTYGISTTTNNNSGKCYGVKAMTYGNNNSNTTQFSIGISGLAGITHTAVGLFGGIVSSSLHPCYNFAGVYGSETTTSPSFTNYSGTYAGYFKGKVRVTNGIYATVLSPSASASPSGQNGTTILSERGESVTDKLAQVQTLQFLRYDPTNEEHTAKTNPTDLDIDNMSPEELDSLVTNADEEPERYLSAVQYGLAADQLKVVYPELVYEDANGNVSINYVEMIPLLVQSINELSAKVETLEQQLGAKKNARNSKQQTTTIGKTKQENSQKDNSTYDLSGRRVANPQHGVYVQDGKKVALK